MDASLPQHILAHLASDPDHGIDLKDYPDNLPFLFEPKHPTEAAILLVHGFTATPWEMRSLGAALQQAGFAVFGLCLPGHGTRPEDLKTCRYEDWLQGVEQGYQTLTKSYPRVYGLGMSTGALLLLALARRQPICGLVLLSPFLRLRHRLAPLISLLRHIRSYQNRVLPAELATHYYQRRPLNGIHQIQRLIRTLRSDLKNIGTPTLIFSAQGDQTVDAASAHTLLSNLGSENKHLHQFGFDVAHVLATKENPRWEEMVERILGFFRELERKEPAFPATGHTAP